LNISADLKLDRQHTLNVESKSILNWAQQWSDCCLLDHNNYQNYPGNITNGYLAVGARSKISIPIGLTNALPRLQAWLDKQKDWTFGYLSYELKNQIEELSSRKATKIDFGLLHFFVPEYLFEFKIDGVKLIRSKINIKELENKINEFNNQVDNIEDQEIRIKSTSTKNQYLEKISSVQQHIQLGDIYEMNFCQEFFVENIGCDPLQLFQRLNANSKAPFASFFKSNQQYLICASPERYLQRKGERLISQPIKGTRKREASKVKDLEQKNDLIHSQKDRSEHVMIVDLVRNDLGKCCKPGTVKPTELFGIYSFEHVHQMISTIEGTLIENQTFTDILRATFPMGSMTGAPKISAMQLIDQYEASSRGLYSGSVGYIKPNGDFDFNVVIRSMLYDQQKALLSFHVGGAIVAESDPEAEYEECLTKATGIHRALGSQ